MGDQFSDSLSALVDGEASEFEVRRLLDRLDQQSELGRKWQRYHLIRSVIRGEHDNVRTDISQTVMARIGKEPLEGVTSEPQAAVGNAALSPGRPGRGAGGGWRSLVSMATAASVTAAVILGVQGFNSEPVTDMADSQRPQYVLPGIAGPDDFIRAQFGQERTLSGLAPQGEVIRLSRGLERYIDQHQHMLTAKQPGWQARWLPDGFQNVRHEVLPESEVMLFSDGRHAVSVCIEPFGRQSVAEGVTQSSDMVAVGKRQGQYFVTVVGDVPLMIADRIASSVQVRN
ncbi:MucB/RseB C-terminal domain-containing protein [Marinobacterium aestuariivivens]|uniref:MucB/RseB C-terminal domain-containing protein n=1 Tax=Marinobacterium aestuariivivens TaxID=1698799 RepID=A0ABW2A2K0_9GAMM